MYRNDGQSRVLSEPLVRIFRTPEEQHALSKAPFFGADSRDHSRYNGTKWVEVRNLIRAEGQANHGAAHWALGFYGSGFPYKCRDKQTVNSSASEQLLTSYLQAMRRRT